MYVNLKDENGLTLLAHHQIVRTVLYKSNNVLRNFSGDTKNCFLGNIRHLCEIE
jgi:hypothetical protein